MNEKKSLNQSDDDLAQRVKEAKEYVDDVLKRNSGVINTMGLVSV